jgi:predicted ATPase
VDNPNLFVVTGGPGCGKTTVLLELEKLGFSYAPEVARQIIQEQVRSGGRALPWDDRELYTKVMLEQSIESYKRHASTSQVTFADRGIPDTLGYARLIGLEDQSAIQSACSDYRYARRVFFAPAWKEIYATDQERKQDFAEAQRTCDQILEVYQECGYEVVELPRIAPGERAEFIVEQISALMSEMAHQIASRRVPGENG